MITTSLNTSRWSGPVQTEWLPDGRGMILLRDVTYRDGDGRPWYAYAGETVDGASIPWFFWRVIGSPFCGLYRQASVIHDVYCQRRCTSSGFVHNVFHDIMLYDGVPPVMAAMLAAGVHMFGPRFRGRLP